MNRYIIDFIDSLSKEAVDQYLSDNNLTVVRNFDSLGHVYLVSSDTPPTVNDTVVSVILDSDNPIQLLGIDVTLTDSNQETSFDIEDTKNWWKVVSLDHVDFDQPTYSHTVKGQNSTVYILDSGIETTHTEFQDKNIVLLHSFTGEFSDNRGHGTGIASVVSGATCGLTDATIKVVKIFDPNTATLQSDLLYALDAVLSDYISNNKQPSVVNLSWGIAKNEYINSKIQTLINQGMFIVAAAGNSGVPIADVTPASIPDVLTVGSYGQSLTPSNFSNYTDQSLISYTSNETNYGVLDGWAPGENIWVAGLNNSYGFAAGTSLSAGIASGAIAYNLSNYMRDNVASTESYYTNYVDRKNRGADLSDLNVREGDSVEYNINSVYLNICIARPDTLDLSDPKYASSAKQIVTYFTTLVAKPKTLSFVVFENLTTTRPAFSRKAVQRVTSESDLPSWAAFDERGMLVMSTPSTGGDPYIMVEPILLDVTNRDGTSDAIMFSIVVKRSDITNNNAASIIPEDDPVLSMVLYSRSCWGQSGCGYDTCYNDCGPYGAGFCNNYASGKLNCCFCSSDIRLKKDIEFVKRIDDTNIYNFRYIWEDNTAIKHTGVMAHEILNSEFNDAVVVDRNGYYLVDRCSLPENIQELMV